MSTQFAFAPSTGLSHARTQHLPSPCGLVEDALALFHQLGHSDEAFQAIGDRLRRFAAQSNLAALLARARVTGGARMLSETIDGSIALILERLSPSHAVPLPNHVACSIAAVVQGRVRYVTWEQPAPDTAANPATQRIACELELTAGDFVYFPESPGERHGQQAIGGEVWELRLIGRESVTWNDETRATNGSPHVFASAA